MNEQASTLEQRVNIMPEMETVNNWFMDIEREMKAESKRLMESCRNQNAEGTLEKWAAETQALWTLHSTLAKLGGDNRAFLGALAHVQDLMHVTLMLKKVLAAATDNGPEIEELRKVHEKTCERVQQAVESAKQATEEWTTTLSAAMKLSVRIKGEWESRRDREAA